MYAFKGQTPDTTAKSSISYSSARLNQITKLYLRGFTSLLYTKNRHFVVGMQTQYSRSNSLKVLGEQVTNLW